MIKKHRWWFLSATIAALLLRLFFVFKMAVIAGDSLVYGDLAKCILDQHMYGIGRLSGGCEPTLIRLPGYPFFLAFTFLLSGQDHYIGAMLVQLVFDLLTCFLIADIARRVFSERAGRSAFVLAAFCPFLMSYAATPLTECLEIFWISAAIDGAIIALDTRLRRWWVLTGLACAAAILLRPDGGLLLGCIGIPLALYFWRDPARRRELLTAILLLGVVSLSPLVPWTIRNWRVLHVFEPLVTVNASDPGEYRATGSERWVRTWLIDYSNTEDICFHIPGETIDAKDIPDRAYTSEAQRALVRSLVAQYNVELTLTPEMDRKFGAMADENIRLHPIRYHFLMPAARLFDMWFRPRGEMMPLDVHFWEFAKDPHDAWCNIALAGLNFFYVAAAVAGAWLLRRRIRYLALLLTYLIVRSLFLANLGQSEDRYTMECFPFILVLAGVFLGWFEERRQAAEPAA